MNDIDNYIKTHNITKLHLGCGANIIKDWLNTDISKDVIKKGKAVYLDVTKPFDISDSTFDYIFSEHLFEHLTYEEGMNMINECYRILKPGGVMRLSTPSLEFLIDLYYHPDKEINKEYLKFDAKRANTPIGAVYAISHFHTAWNHKIIYDSDSLHNILINAGFKKVYKCEVGESEYESLRNIENHFRHFKRLGCVYDFNKLQSMIFEAQK